MKAQKLLVAAAIAVSIAGCSSSSGKAKTPSPVQSARPAPYAHAADLAAAIGCTDVRSAGKGLFPGAADDVASCSLGGEHLLLATFADSTAREVASGIETRSLSGTTPHDFGLVDGANWVVSGYNSGLAVVAQRTHGRQERPKS